MKVVSSFLLVALIFCIEASALTDLGRLFSGNEIHPRNIKAPKYSFIRGSFDWKTAQIICRGYDSEIARIMTPEEHETARAMIADNAWIGLVRSNACETGWVWVETEECLSADVARVAWANGEPNDGSGDSEDCVEYHKGKDRKWNDEMCKVERDVLCQNF